MKLGFKLLFAILALLTSFNEIRAQLKIGKVKYQGGGDWYANKTSLPNLIRFCNQELKTKIDENPEIIDLNSNQIFRIPFIHLTGHGNVIFNDSEIKQLRKYLIAGGFLHIDDNYGLDVPIRREMKKVFPELEFIELPYSHPIFHQKYDFPKGLPKIHEHDNKPSQGFGLIYQGRLICFYSYECDLGNGWEDEEIYHDSAEKREKALQMGTNIIQYAFLNQ
ncbi:DUF4159 domain-containing protein [Aquirufa sp. ROCK2-A2]